MKQVTKYVADDGTEFTDESECEKYEATSVRRLTELTDMAGRTILSVRETTVRDRLEAIVIEFTDRSEIILIGGGYDGYGDYIRVATPDENPTP